MSMLDGLERPDIDPEWFVRPNGYDAAHGIHGIGHTLRVWVHGQRIAHAVGFEPWQVEAVGLAAVWHDIGRTNDGADYYHGAKSAGKVIGLGLHRPVDHRVCEAALYAVTHHSGSEEHGLRAASWLFDPAGCTDVFKALKDADGLDRVRLGDLDASYLRFEESRGMVDVAWALYRECG